MSEPALEAHSNILSQLRRRLDKDEFTKIRRLWRDHSVAEDARDIPGLIATLTEDCVYAIPQSEIEWRGHAGAERFYTELLTAFPDVHFDLQNIVIGPQGVFEEAHVTGTHEGKWLHHNASGKAVEFDVLIFFPWNAEQELFRGERVWFFNLEEQLAEKA
ncbi:MAG: nuclear transport factor 2 family protein [Chloroflexi bacterium]|nr:MAG: nuclear transport factor 2 family protein [Chloroflexota bacterium]MBL1194031.1 nuclear transport factor 2 family protein [Chloroflexota bacterium]NOH11325.1 nuclear transport factor 2 family protein [Chloroflexota bacterium]